MLQQGPIDWNTEPVVDEEETVQVAQPQSVTGTVDDVDGNDGHVEVTANGQSSSENEAGDTDQGLKIVSGDRSRKTDFRPASTLVRGKKSLAEKEYPAKANTHRLLKDLNNQNKELLAEKVDAIKWQDAASMAIKEAKDEAETRKEETKAAKKVSLLTKFRMRRQLDDSKSEAAVLKRDLTLAANEKATTEATHREATSVAQRKVDDLRVRLNSAIRNSQKSTEQSEELSKKIKDMQDELEDKKEDLAAKDREKKELQDKIDVRDSTIEHYVVEARKDRAACNRYCSDKFESERLQREAESKVAELERKALAVKAQTDRAREALQIKLDEAVTRENEAKAKTRKVEGDVEVLERSLEETEWARDDFRLREERLAARFAGSRGNASVPPQDTAAATSAPVSATEQQTPATTANEAEPSKEAADDWKRKTRRKLARENETALATERATIRRELEEENRTALATERTTIRRELEEENRTALATEQATIRRGLEEQNRTALATEQATTRHRLEEENRTALATEQARIRNQLQTEFQNNLANQKAQWRTEFIAAERPQLETAIQSELLTQLQAGYDNQLAKDKTQWKVDYAANERPQLESRIRDQVRTEYQQELSDFKAKWEVDHSPSPASVEAQKKEGSAKQIEKEPGVAGSGPTRSAEDDMLLASLSRESDENHALFLEMEKAGLSTDPEAYVVFGGLNRAKEALYDVKCELRKPDAAVNKNNLLYSMKDISVNKHYIQKLDPKTREALIHQANEANRRLEYVQGILASNNDVPKDAMLVSLLTPLNDESEHRSTSASSQTASGFGNAANLGAPAFPLTGNGFGMAAAPGRSVLTAANDSRTSAAPGQFVFPPVIGSQNPVASGTSVFPSIIGSQNPVASGTSMFAPNSFGSVATPVANKTYPTLPSTSQKPFSGLAPATRKINKASGVFNPFEASNFENDRSLGITPSQNDQGSGSSNQVAETQTDGKHKLKKNSVFLIHKGKGSVPSISLSPAADEDHQMDTDRTESPLPGTQGHSGTTGSDFLTPRAARQVLRPKSQQRGSSPKGRQLAHQAFAQTSNVSAPTPSQDKPANPQEQAPTTQQAGSTSSPRTPFTLEPNHGFGKCTFPHLNNFG